MRPAVALLFALALAPPLVQSGTEASGEVTFAGAFAPGDPSARVHALAVGGTALLRISFSATAGASLAVFDPDSALRATLPPSTRDAVVGLPAGAWRLVVHDARPVGDVALHPYEVRVLREPHAHGLAASVPASSGVGFAVEVPDGRFAFAEFLASGRVRAAPLPGGGSASLWGEGVTLERFRLDDASGCVVDAPAALPPWEGFLGEPAVGGRVGAHDVAMPALLAPDGLWMHARRYVAEGPGPFAWRVGVASSEGRAGWLYAVWDEGVPPARIEPTTGRFARLAAFEGPGPVVMAGPYAWAEGVSFTDSDAGGLGGMTTVQLDLTPRALAALMPAGRLAGPGVHLAARGDAVAWSGAASPGIWTATLDHVDGRLADAVLYARADYAFGPC